MVVGSRGPGARIAATSGLGPGDHRAVHVDRLREQPPLGVGEAQSRSDRDMSEPDPIHDCSYRCDLPAESLDERCPVSVVDEQSEVRSAPASEVALLDLAGVVLRVDDPDTARCDDEMVDVASDEGDAPVVKDHSDIAETLRSVAGRVVLRRRPPWRGPWSSEAPRRAVWRCGRSCPFPTWPRSVARRSPCGVRTPCEPRCRRFLCRSAAAEEVVCHPSTGAVGSRSRRPDRHDRLPPVFGTKRSTRPARAGPTTPWSRPERRPRTTRTCRRVGEA